ncbi:MAG: proteasome accessory factor PafA2 family protein, partial [Candidatus Methylomirabilis sp.]|nr:proteasome accessory factor PafA2 family protein [Deltaproteobacteria bacterium]
MIDRIYGLENEYGIIFTSKGRASLPAENAIRYLFEKLIPYEYFLNVFLENGARLYQDTGCHPEYATPECFDPMDLVRYDRAGDRIIEELLNYAEFRSEEEGLKGKLSIFKNNTDFFGNSYGCHENYLVDRYVNFDYMAQKLIPFLVTRQVFAGSGRVVDKCVDGVYCISQRAE